jgi:hypothetical protein
MAALLSSSGAGFLAPAGKTHACTDHVCYCSRAAAPTAARPGDAPCHGASSSRPTSTLQSTCDHEPDGFTLAAPAKPALLADAPVTLVPETGALPPPAPAHPRLRAVAPEIPPPRSASC